MPLSSLTIIGLDERAFRHRLFDSNAAYPILTGPSTQAQPNPFIPRRLSRDALQYNGF